MANYRGDVQNNPIESVYRLYTMWGNVEYLDWNNPCYVLIQGYDRLEAIGFIGHGGYGIDIIYVLGASMLLKMSPLGP